MTDLRLGIYRRIYSGFLWGKRINSVSLECEAWFWRLLVVADDFGNLPAEEARLCALTKGLRHKMRDSDVAAYCACLEQARLISGYSAEDERFYHVHDWEKLQPCSRNGRRYQRFPLHPAGLGESGCILGNPGESGSAPTQQQQHQDQHQNPTPTTPPLAEAGVVLFTDEEIRNRIGYLLIKPEWAQTWITQRGAEELAVLPITEDDVKRVYTDARRSRNTLKNPAGYVVAELKRIAAKAGGGE